jgi:hypothetical protein
MRDNPTSQKERPSRRFAEMASDQHFLRCRRGDKRACPTPCRGHRPPTHTGRLTWSSSQTGTSSSPVERTDGTHQNAVC